jgi:hypothetical protein
MVFELEQATYLLGIIAGRESKTGKAGVVGGIKLPSIASTFLAFEAGARSINPKFEIKEIYTGNFDDVGAAKLATLSLINAGCDFIFHQANEAGRGVFQACSERKVRCFGSNKNQNDLAPDVIVASAVLDVPSAFVFMAKTVRDHRFKPQVYWLGMKEGIVSLAWNDRLKPTIAPATVAEVERVEKEIRAGTFVVPRGKFGGGRMLRCRDRSSFLVARSSLPVPRPTLPRNEDRTKRDRSRYPDPYIPTFQTLVNYRRVDRCDPGDGFRPSARARLEEPGFIPSRPPGTRQLAGSDPSPARRAPRTGW